LQRGERKTTRDHKITGRGKSQQRDREKNDAIRKENDHPLEMTNEITGQRTTQEGRKGHSEEERVAS
jgi:hypothetical protein